MRPAFKNTKQEAHFSQHGYLLLKNVLSDSLIKNLKTVWAAHSALHDAGLSVTMLLRDTETRSKIQEDITACVASAFEEIFQDYEIVLGTFLVKQAGDGYMNPHQDPSVIDEQRSRNIIVWIPLVPANEANGTLKVMPYGHKFNDNLRPMIPLPYNDLIDHMMDKTLVPIDADIGDALVMDGRLIHGSGKNTSNVQRIAVSCIAVPAEEQTIFCHLNEEKEGNQLDVYNVPKDFLTRHMYGQAPQEGDLIRTIPYTRTPHSKESMEALTRSGTSQNT